MLEKLLVPLDGSALAEQALSRTAAIARAAHAAVDIVTVHQSLPFAGVGGATWNANHLADEDKYLETISAELATGSSLAVTRAVLHGDPVQMICSRARDTDADLIVMTTHGRTGLSRAWMGSVADGVLRASQVPVLVLRPVRTSADRRAARHLFKRILVPIDGSALSLEILSAAADLARCSEAQLVLLRVVQPVAMLVPGVELPFAYMPPVQDDIATHHLADQVKRELVDQARTIPRDGLAGVEAHVVVGANVAKAILDFALASGATAIAMSTHGRGASRLIVGSVADKVFRGARVPVLFRRPAVIGAMPVLNAAAVESQLPALSGA